jgi:hypothetical protein
MNGETSVARLDSIILVGVPVSRALMSSQSSHPCVYRKLKPERSGDEVRPKGRVNL